MKKILVLSVERINPIALRALPLKQGKFLGLVVLK